jgi:hypothetical protein
MMNMATNFDTQIAFKCNEQPQVCCVSDLKKGDIFYLVTNGKRGDLMKAIADPVWSKNRWEIAGELYE